MRTGANDSEAARKCRASESILGIGCSSNPSPRANRRSSSTSSRSARRFVSVVIRPGTPVLRLQSVATVTFGDFEWDAEKAAANAAKHGVTFEDAVAPERFVAIGVSRRARVLFVVHCERREKLRIVSARRATRR